MINIPLCVCVCLCVGIVCTHIWMKMNAYVYVCVYTCTYVCMNKFNYLKNHNQHPLVDEWIKKTYIYTYIHTYIYSSVQFSSVAQSCPTLCDPTNPSTPGLPVHHQLPEFTQTHVHWVSDAIQPSHPLSSPFPPVPNPCQHQSLFQWVNSLHEVAKVLEFQL